MQSNKMSLLDVPQGVLQFVLAPMLCRESRMALSEALPCRRVYGKFARDFAEQHHMKLCQEKWSAMLRNIEACEHFEQRRKRILRLIQDLGRPVHSMFTRRNLAFRTAMVRKIEELMEAKPEQITDRWWRMFQRQCARTLAVHAA